MSTTDLSAAPLSWGHGPQTLEVFAEPTCPFSIKAQNKLGPVLEAMGKDAVTIKLRLHSQPWHLWSAVVCRCIAAASTLPEGRDKAWAVIAAVADKREDFVCKNHCSGDNLQVSPSDIIARAEQASGIAIADAFENSDLIRVMKWHTKYARQNGIHSSPTFMINGIVQPALESDADVATLVEAIRSTPLY